MTTKDLSKLVPIQKLVVRDGKTFLQTFHVSPEDAKKQGHNVGRSQAGDRAEEVTSFLRGVRKKLGSDKYRDLVRANGITWDETDKDAPNTMRATMAAATAMKNGHGFDETALDQKTVTAPPTAVPKPDPIQAPPTPKPEPKLVVKVDPPKSNPTPVPVTAPTSGDPIDAFMESWRLAAREYYIKLREENQEQRKKKYPITAENLKIVLQYGKFGNLKYKDSQIQEIMSTLQTMDDYKKKRIESEISSGMYAKWIGKVGKGNVALVESAYNDDELDRILAKEVVNRKKKFVATVENAGGKIIDTTRLNVGVDGSLNGLVKCEKGDVEVNTIYAGGYNIQVLHYRTLVKLRPATAASVPDPTPVPQPVPAPALDPAPKPTQDYIGKFKPAQEEVITNFLNSFLGNASPSKPTEIWQDKNGNLKMVLEENGGKRSVRISTDGKQEFDSKLPFGPKYTKVSEVSYAAAAPQPTPAPIPAPAPAPAPQPDPTPIAPVQPSGTPKIDEFFNAMFLPTRNENGNYIIGLGHLEVTNKWGKPETAPGSLKLREIKKLNGQDGHWIRLDSAFLDKDVLKNDFKAQWGGKYDSNDKSWYIPFALMPHLFNKFRNVTVDASIAPTVKAVFEKHDPAALVAKVNAGIPSGGNGSTSATISNKADIDISNWQLPSGMQNPFDPSKPLELYDHQKKGFNFILQNKKAVLGLAVGLGKTLTAIAGVQELVNRGEIKRAVVIAPASVKFNWRNEIEGDPKSGIKGFSSLKACVLESDELRGSKGDAKWKEAENSQVIIVNYDMLRKPEIQEKLRQLAPDCVIADEAHKLKNGTAQQTKGFKDTWKNAKYKWFLTATPFPNGQPQETYTILSHLRPEKVGSWTRDFGRNHVVWENAGRFGSKAVALKNLPELKAKMDDVVFIRTHHSPDVTANLPKERHTTFSLEMNDDQKKMYKAIADDIGAELAALEKQGVSASTPALIAKLKKLEQVAIDPDMLKIDRKDVDMNKLYPKEEWAVNSIVDHLQDTANRGVVLFCDMKMPLDKVAQGLKNQGVTPSQIAYITGDVKPDERTRIQEKMKTGEVKVVLCTNAAEEGVNLQHGAHTLIHLDIPWVPKSVTQREGRVLRQGQTNPFTQFWTPIINGTVEDKKRGKLGMKVGTIEQLLGAGAAGSAANNIGTAQQKSLSLSDIRSMLV